MNEPIAPRPPSTFTMQGFVNGCIMMLPLLPAIGLYGLAFGVMASAKGLSGLESTLFSAIVYAGGAQMASLQSWAPPIPLLAVVMTTVAMNARYILLGATLRPWMQGLSPAIAYPSLFMLVDANWVLSLREETRGNRDIAFLVGSGFASWLLWVSVTLIGHQMGEMMSDARAYGVDFMLALFFATMIVPFLKAGRDITPLIVGVAVSIIVDQLMPGPWSILAGALAGSLAGAWRYDPQK